jgi:uncharacterized membrane protein YvbJ
MFCPSCGRENPDNVAFCMFCGKAMTPAATPKDTQTNPTPKRATAPKTKISFTTVKALVTVLLIVSLALVILQLYYPTVLPWN